ncbi:MAG: tRNA uridine-5-carboxymethylaminomethyl(34) synthesis GTPase MnmE [Desulfobulbaceae bacterium]|jgi:tRNA modification GTPase|nr:tRNA uridine-5-carboxymethylaminomethyl(34) synthesis GTPase MnmE [Desulfobulbaceae bacterium]
MSLSELSEPTIAAIATPPGPGGIGVIRMSGDLSLGILKRVFVPKNVEKMFVSHHLSYGDVVDPETGQMVDEVLAVYMAAPATYTREDVVEIHCHGSFLILQQVLSLLISRGATLASPGEFTKRAFLNGRIDLTRAEAVMELLDATTSAKLDMARNQLGGGLYDQIMAIRQQLLVCRGIIEVAIDFPDEDAEILDGEKMIGDIRHNVIAPLEDLIRSARRGQVFREGVSVVILGRPNVGKSSLLNGLLREERAIVTSVPGTTRDTIEEIIDIRGLPVRIVDTAGIREHAGKVEEIGINRAKAKLAQADFVLFLIDGPGGISAEELELRKLVQGKPVLFAVNKIDVMDYEPADFAEFCGKSPQFGISAKLHLGIEALENGLYSLVTSGDDWDPGHGVVPNVRHRLSLEKGLEAAQRVTLGLGQGLSADLLAVDLQDVLDGLGDIIGETTTEDVLDVIFEQFCLGK